MKSDRLNEYRIMWVLIMFDLPTETKIQRKEASNFRKYLISDGFTIFQYSIYVRHCASFESADTHIKRVSKNIPGDGKVCIITITDKQFGNIKLFEGSAKVSPEPVAIQLELF